MDERVGVQIGQRIKMLREAAQLTQAELAALSLKSVETISNFERAKTTPSVHTLHVLAWQLKCGVADFFADGPVQTEDEDPTVMRIANKARLLSDADQRLLADFADLLIARAKRQ